MKSFAKSSPFVSELGAALLGWRRGYLGFPADNRRSGDGRWLVVDVLFFDRLRLTLVEHPVEQG